MDNRFLCFFTSLSMFCLNAFTNVNESTQFYAILHTTYAQINDRVVGMNWCEYTGLRMNCVVKL